MAFRVSPYSGLWIPHSCPTFLCSHFVWMGTVMTWSLHRHQVRKFWGTLITYSDRSEGGEGIQANVATVAIKWPSQSPPRRDELCYRDCSDVRVHLPPENYPIRAGKGEKKRNNFSQRKVLTKFAWGGNFYRPHRHWGNHWSVSFFLI